MGVIFWEENFGDAIWRFLAKKGAVSHLDFRTVEHFDH